MLISILWLLFSLIPRNASSIFSVLMFSVFGYHAGAGKFAGFLWKIGMHKFRRVYLFGVLLDEIIDSSFSVAFKLLVSREDPDEHWNEISVIKLGLLGLVVWQTPAPVFRLKTCFYCFINYNTNIAAFPYIFDSLEIKSIFKALRYSLWFFFDLVKKY